MSNSNQHRDLDRLLQDWAQHYARPQDSGPLQQRIVDAWRDQTPTEEPSTNEPRARHSWRYAAGWFSLGVAVAASLALLLHSRLPSHSLEPHSDPIPEVAWIGSSQQAAKLELMRELEHLFEDRLAWIAEPPGGVQVEIRDVGTGDRKKSARLAVRVVVVQRPLGAAESDWTPIWTTDLLTYEEQTIRFSSQTGPDAGVAELSLWAYRVDDQVVVVDSALALGGLRRRGNYECAQVSGIPRPLDAFQQDGSEFRVLQTVAILDQGA